VNKNTIIKIGMFIMLVAFCSIPPISASNLNWEVISSLPTGRTTLESTVIGNKIYSIGGRGADGSYSNKVEVYDSLANTWISQSTSPTPLVFFGLTSTNGKLYAVGGVNNAGTSQDTVLEYNPANDTWESKSAMITKRHDLAVAEVSGMLYAIGGRSSLQAKILNSVERYNPTTNSWVTLANMPTARDSIRPAVINEKIYIIGGNSTLGTTTPGTAAGVRNVEVYTPATNTWEEKSDIPVGVYAYGISVLNNKIYILGGVKDDGTKSNLTQIYDSLTDTWTYGPTLSSDTSLNNDLYKIGGTSDPSLVEKYSLQELPGTNSARAILVVTMTTGLEKEYDLSMQEVNAFIDWYEAKQEGTGKATYAINKHDNNKGPFKNRKDYILFDRILTFEVSEY
jgi:hypothetical protein